MNMAAGGTASIIVIFPSLYDHAQNLCNKYQADTPDETVNRKKRGRVFPGKMPVLRDKEIDNQEDDQGDVKILPHPCPVFLGIQKSQFFLFIHENAPLKKEKYAHQIKNTRNDANIKNFLE